MTFLVVLEILIGLEIVFSSLVVIKQDLVVLYRVLRNCLAQGFWHAVDWGRGLLHTFLQM